MYCGVTGQALKNTGGYAGYDTAEMGCRSAAYAFYSRQVTKYDTSRLTQEHRRGDIDLLALEDRDEWLEADWDIFRCLWCTLELSSCLAPDL